MKNFYIFIICLFFTFGCGDSTKEKQELSTSFRGHPDSFIGDVKPERLDSSASPFQFRSISEKPGETRFRYSLTSFSTLSPMLSLEEVSIRGELNISGDGAGAARVQLLEQDAESRRSSGRKNFYSVEVHRQNRINAVLSSSGLSDLTSTWGELRLHPFLNSQWHYLPAAPMVVGESRIDSVPGVFAESGEKIEIRHLIYFNGFFKLADVRCARIDTESGFSHKGALFKEKAVLFYDVEQKRIFYRKARLETVFRHESDSMPKGIEVRSESKELIQDFRLAEPRYVDVLDLEFPPAATAIRTAKRFAREAHTYTPGTIDSLAAKLRSYLHPSYQKVYLKRLSQEARTVKTIQRSAMLSILPHVDPLVSYDNERREFTIRMEAQWQKKIATRLLPPEKRVLLVTMQDGDTSQNLVTKVQFKGSE